MIPKEAKIYVAGHAGLVGSAFIRHCRSLGHDRLLTAERRDLDLTRQDEVEKFFRRERPDHVVIAAAKVGGIKINSEQPAEFLYENVSIAANVIHAAFETSVSKLLYLGSSCIYPRACRQPMRESDLLTGPLEPTNEGYALAKIAGMKLCEYFHREHGARFVSAMPTNVYGPGDNYHPDRSHVIGGLIRRFHEAKLQDLPEVNVWGSGQARREFIHSDDLAEAMYLILDRYEEAEFINVGSGQEVSIADLSRLVKETVGFRGELRFDTSRPDGMPRKLLDLTKLESFGWRAGTALDAGLAMTYRDFLVSFRETS